MTQTAQRGDKLTIGVLYGFRALMVLFVCNYHIWQQSWLSQKLSIAGSTLYLDFFTRSSYLFVDGMLLLSGFLLYLPHARAAVYGTPVDTVKSFYRKRFVRIVPSYLASVLILFVLAISSGTYQSAAEGITDILAHLSFTFTFFQDTYMYTALNGVLWTIGIEVQFYLVFPLIVRSMRTKPVLTLSLMAAGGVLFRAVLGVTVSDLAMLVNQLPSFLDVYALGMLGAILYIRLEKWTRIKPVKNWVNALSVPLFALAVYVLLRLLRFQSSSSTDGINALRLSQWIIRLPFAASILIAMLSAAFMPRILQKLLDNKPMRFVSTISLNLYIWHQILAAQVIRPYFPDTLQSDPAMQIPYTLTCYSLAILTAMAFTYGLEHPAAKWIQRLLHKKGEIQHERSALTETR